MSSSSRIIIHKSLKEYEKEFDEYIKNHTPKINKESFLQSLDEIQIARAIRHFDTIYECKSWGEREKNMAYLAWLLGKGHLMISDHFMFYEMVDVEFNAHNYEITFESDTTSGICIDLTKDYYELEKPYSEILMQ